MSFILIFLIIYYQLSSLSMSYIPSFILYKLILTYEKINFIKNKIINIFFVKFFHREDLSNHYIIYYRILSFRVTSIAFGEYSVVYYIF